MSGVAPPVQERDVVRWGMGLALVAAVIGIIVGSVLWADGLLHSASPTGLGTGALDRVGPEPATIAGVRVDAIDTDPGLASRRALAGALSTYAWVDRRQGVIRIPIERAMELVANGQAPPLGPPAEERP